MQTKTRHVTLRIPEAELERIDQLATAEGLTRTAYVIRASLGELDESPDHERLNMFDEQLSIFQVRLLTLERPVGITN